MISAVLRMFVPKNRVRKEVKIIKATNQNDDD